MKDPNCGPLGAVALVVVLLGKFSALSVLAAANSPWPFVLAALLGRTLLLPLFMTTDYVRPGGLGSAMHAHLSHRTGWLLVTALALTLTAGGLMALGATLAAVLTFIVLRHVMLRTIGGMTGDTAGALVEIVEAAALLTCTALV